LKAYWEAKKNAGTSNTPENYDEAK